MLQGPLLNFNITVNPFAVVGGRREFVEVFWWYWRSIIVSSKSTFGSILPSSYLRSPILKLWDQVQDVGLFFNLGDSVWVAFLDIKVNFDHWNPSLKSLWAISWAMRLHFRSWNPLKVKTNQKFRTTKTPLARKG